MNQAFADWLAALPAMEGQSTNVRKLLKGLAESGEAIWIVVDASDEDGYFDLGYVDRFEGGEMQLISVSVGPRHYFRVVERYGTVTLDRLADFVRCISSWEYELNESVEQAAQVFSTAKAVDEDTWAEHVAEVFGPVPTLAACVEDLPTGPGNMIPRIRVPLMEYMYHLRSLDDPRQFVADMQREDMPETLVQGGAGRRGVTLVGSRLRFTIRPDALRDDVSGVRRKLAAVLTGAVVETHFADDQTCTVVAERGDYDVEAWKDLTKEWINHLLVEMPNDPVVKVARGNYAMQLLVVLEFQPNAQELAYIGGVGGVVHVSLAEPASVYGPRTVSLFVPEVDLDDEEDIEAFEDMLREYMAFL